jgi:YhcH/YjgK/YiaL family protein
MLEIRKEINEALAPIFDTLENAEKYYAMHPRFKQAFESLKNIDLNTIEVGKHELDGTDIFVIIAEGPLKNKADAKLEIHNVYIDIQILLDGNTEGFGWSPRSEVVDAVEEFNTEKDIQFFKEQPQVYYNIQKGMFTIFMPEDAHAPMVGEGEVRKAVVKVRK